MLVFKHPKYYAELNKIRLEHERKLASEQASEQANRWAGGPTSNKQRKVTSGSRASKR